VENLAAMQTPFNEALIFAFGFGLLLGVLVTAMNIGTNFAQKKLNLKDSEVLKYFAVCLLIGAAYFLVFFVGVSLWAPDFSVRQEIFNRHLETLGYGLFFTLNFLGMAIVSLLEIIISRSLTKAHEHRK
jgi:hypothetical protein